MVKATQSKSIIEKYQLQDEILKNITTGIFLSTVTDGTIIYTNPKCEKMFGYSDGEMVGKNTAILYAPADLNSGPTRDDIREFIKKNGEWQGEVCRIKKDGSIFWSYSNSTIIHHTTYGEVYVVVHTDISGLKIPPGSPNGSEEKYRSLFMISRDALMTLEPPLWKFTSGNPAAVKLFKAKNETEFLSYEPWQLSPKKQPDGCLSVEKAKKMIGKAIKDGENLFEWTHKRIDGEEFFADVQLSKTKREGKDVLYATVRDISDRKNFFKKIQEQEKQTLDEKKKYESLLESIGDGVIATDGMGNILFINKPAVEMLGHEFEAVQNKKLVDFVNMLDVEEKPIL
ncbi:MAG: PAS domain S-box protein, partial [Patescibacteria group bacterium]